MIRDVPCPGKSRDKTIKNPVVPGQANDPGLLNPSSTVMATWMLTETINFYTSRGGPVYLCLLDLSKAFDNIKLDML